MTLLIKNFTKHRLDKKHLGKVVDKTLKVAGFRGPVEISLVITGEKRIRSLNRRYRNVDRVTDVLSFGNELTEDRKSEFINPPDKITYLGEIFICYPQAEKQAKQKKHSVRRELTILLIHGVLHLLGYDHKSDWEKSRMECKEKKILKSL